MQEHEFFQRDGNDLHCTVPLPFTTLALGGEIKVPGSTATRPSRFPESTQTGATFRCAARACPTCRAAVAAIMLVTVRR